jgi:hypothetical protein
MPIPFLNACAYIALLREGNLQLQLRAKVKVLEMWKISSEFKVGHVSS